MSRTAHFLAPWTLGVVLACSSEPQPPPPGTDGTGSGSGTTETWDGVQRDTLVYAELTDINNMLYIVSEQISDANVIGFTNINGFDSEFDCDITLKPLFYKNWSFSDDGTVVKIELDPTIKWRDGQPLTAEDMQFTFDLIRDPTVASARLNQTEHMIEGKDPLIVDPTHIEFHFTHPYNRTTMLEHCDIPPVPKHILENADRASLRGVDINSKQPMENGPFKMVKWDRGQRVVLEANDTYTGPADHKARIKRIIVRIIPEYATRLLELETGGIDMMEGLQVADVDRLKKEHPELTFYRRGYRTQDYVAWNELDPQDYKRVLAATPKGQQVDLTKVKPNPFFADKNVRTALAYAVDVNKLIKDLLTSETGEPYAKVATSTISPALCNVYNDQVTPLGFDPEKAKSLLAEAGWKDTDGDGWLDKDGRKFSFTMSTNAGNARRNKATIIIQAQLKNVGIEAKLEQIDSSTFFERLRKKDFEAALAGWVASLILDPTDMWHSGSQYQFNFPSYSNPDVDALIEKGMMEPDPVKVAEMWKELQAKIYADQPYLFLYWWDDSVAVHKRFREASPDILSAMSDYWKWWVPADEVKYPN